MVGVGAEMGKSFIDGAVPWLVSQQVDKGSGRKAGKLGVRSPLWATNGLEISLCRRQEEQAVSGNRGCWLKLNAVWITHLSLANAQKRFLISKVNLNVPAPQIALE